MSAGGLPSAESNVPADEQAQLAQVISRLQVDLKNVQGFDSIVGHSDAKKALGFTFESNSLGLEGRSNSHPV